LRELTQEREVFAVGARYTRPSMIVRTWGISFFFGTGTAHRRPKQPPCRIAAKRNEGADRKVVVPLCAPFRSDFYVDHDRVVSIGQSSCRVIGQFVGVVRSISITAAPSVKSDKRKPSVRSAAHRTHHACTASLDAADR
jgi:hypothetical protein